ncbi:MAG: hypothetical protein ACREA2_13885 [Blastocatellia bacterium]
MNIKAMKTTGLSIALATAFLVAAGSSTAFAQDWRGRDRDYDGRIDSRRERVQTHGETQNLASLQERKGFNDGLIIGRRDTRARVSFNPSASIRYQLGGFYYRHGFQRGYAQAYRQNANNHGNRNNDWYGRDNNNNRNGNRNANNYGNRNNNRYSRDNYNNRDGNRNDQFRQPGYYDRWGNYYYY